MSTRYKFRDNDKLYFVSFSVVYWIDVFIRNEYKQVLLNSLEFCKKEKGLEVYAWCIMTSHVHLIIGTNNQSLDSIMRDFKSYTSRELRKSIQNNSFESRKEWILWMMKRAGLKNGNNKDFQFWQQRNHPIELSKFDIMKQKLDYLHNNPVVEGFVDKAEEYLYSSARDYYGTAKGLLSIRMIE
ncbi:MAG: transposase [Pseudopedobacter saltans]|uniref:Transposase n=1 Tax=Pseudopedobacter saltans TaxID=151895 RepID=A0A2W5F9H7_9SPHI|nr:MAG: transposase [Pseudopedobacter saltans]